MLTCYFHSVCVCLWHTYRGQRTIVRNGSSPIVVPRSLTPVIRPVYRPLYPVSHPMSHLISPAIWLFRDVQKDALWVFLGRSHFSGGDCSVSACLLASRGRYWLLSLCYLLRLVPLLMYNTWLSLELGDTFKPNSIFILLLSTHHLLTLWGMVPIHLFISIWLLWCL